MDCRRRAPWECRKVLLVPGNPQDLTPEKLDSLLAELSEHYTTDVAVVPQRGYGVTWWEVLIIYLASKGADAIVGRVFDEAVDRIESTVRTWIARRRGTDGDEEADRPFFVAICDEDGDVIRAVELPVDGDPVDVTDREREKGRSPRPQPVTEDDAQEEE